MFEVWNSPRHRHTSRKRRRVRHNESKGGDRRLSASDLPSSLRRRGSVCSRKRVVIKGKGLPFLPFWDLIWTQSYTDEISTFLPLASRCRWWVIVLFYRNRPSSRSLEVLDPRGVDCIGSPWKSKQHFRASRKTGEDGVGKVLVSNGVNKKKPWTTEEFGLHFSCQFYLA